MTTSWPAADTTTTETLSPAMHLSVFLCWIPFLPQSPYFQACRQAHNMLACIPYMLVHCVSRKCTPWCLIITLANAERFSKFFHQVIRRKILIQSHQHWKLIRDFLSVFHGNYVSKIYNNLLIENFPFCHYASPSLVWSLHKGVPLGPTAW